MNILVAFFSASGITKEVAQTVAKVAEQMQGVQSCELFEIAPKVPYTKADLDWTNEQSRTTIECKDKSSRPPLGNSIDIARFDVIIVGFPIWWYSAPPVVFSFLESCDFSGKVIIPFCTSGGSELGSAPRDMQKLVPNAKVLDGVRFNFGANKSSIRKWLNSVGIA